MHSRGDDPMVRGIPYLEAEYSTRVMEWPVNLTSVCADIVRPPTAIVVFTMRSLTPLATRVILVISFFVGQVRMLTEELGSDTPGSKIEIRPVLRFLS
jgi:hypothetical protein